MKKIILILLILSTFLLISCKKDNPVTPQEELVVQDSLAIPEIDTLQKTTQKEIQVIETGVSDACHELLIKMLETSTQYQKDIKGLEAAVKKNGGKGIGISIELIENEYNINTTNKIYRLEVFENYPDRILKINTYVFSTDLKKLYKKDFILDEFSQIDFNQKKLKEIKLYCN